MPEPHIVSVTTAGAASGGAVGLSWVLLGAQADALVVGMLAAIFVSAWLPQINSYMRSAAAVCFATLLAGYGSPHAAAFLTGYIPGSQADSVRMLSAVLIGAGTPRLFPLLLARGAGIAEGKGDQK